ncbi:hypothetical protein [Flexivirga caeni]|nr:hypothetical protein [Flexivirga caeni]
MTWAAVARALWETSGELNARRPRDHPISTSAITSLRDKGRTSCQHVLFMLRWLDLPPEAFLGDGREVTDIRLPAADAAHRLRWDVRGMGATLDDRRREDDLTWPGLARHIGCQPGQLSGLRTARYATNIDLAMRVVQWLGVASTAFIYCGTW